METLNKLLDKARKTCERDSDNCLAEKMKVTRSAVSKWRHGGKINDEQLLRLIEMAQADPGIWALVKTEQATTRIEKKMFGALWDRLSPVTTVIGALVLAVSLAPGAARANPVSIQSLATADHGSLYIM
ncbi:DUF3693 domain-containing protein, partial [Stenotrophomonas sp. NPDC078853]